MVSSRVEGTGFLRDHFHTFSAGPGGGPPSFWKDGLAVSISREQVLHVASLARRTHADDVSQRQQPRVIGGQLRFARKPALDAYAAKLEVEMREYAKKFEFEKAAKVRDTVKELRTKEFLFA